MRITCFKKYGSSGCTSKGSDAFDVRWSLGVCVSNKSQAILFRNHGLRYQHREGLLYAMLHKNEKSDFISGVKKIHEFIKAGILKKLGYLIPCWGTFCLTR